MGLGLEFDQFLNLWISPELKEILETFQLQHSWIFCLIDSEAKDEEGRFIIQRMVPNAKLEARYIKNVDHFLRTIQFTQLRWVSFSF